MFRNKDRPTEQSALLGDKAADEPIQASTFVKLLSFLRRNKQWWLLPILVVLGVIVLLICISFFGGPHTAETEF
jgi:hypothetical protein